MLGHRLFSAAIIITAMVLLVWQDFQLGTPERLGRPGLLLAALAILASGVSIAELMDMWTTERRRLSKSLAVTGAVAMTTVACLPLLWLEYPADCPLGKFGWSLSGFVIAVVLVFFAEMWNYHRAGMDEQGLDDREAGEFTERLAHYVLAFGYLSFLFGFLASHRMIDQSNGVGLLSIITLIATVKMSDAFAYFTGKAIGRNRIAPVLSPKKTLEGAIGSVFGAWFAGAICLFIVAPNVFGFEVEKPFWWFLLYGVLITAAGIAGDLAESLLKRDAKCKDSSKWLPGLGGILDVMDSLVFATPVSFLMWM